MRKYLLVRGAALALALISSASWAAAGRILSFEGEVTVNGQQVTADTVLNQSDTVVTGPDGLVKIVLSDNSILDLDSDSQINIAEYRFDPDDSADNASDIGIVTGTLRYVSGQIAKEDPDDISFNAGNATIGVRGSFISISVCDGGDCE